MPGHFGKIVATCFAALLLGTTHASWSWSFSSSTAADDVKDDSVLVSPIVNRLLETSVKAQSWPTSPPSVFCEAILAFNSDNSDKVFRHLDRLVELLGQLKEQSNLQGLTDHEKDQDYLPLSWESARDVALRDAKHEPLLPLFLALRAGSPLCETHRGLARQILLNAGKLHADVDAVAVVYPEGLVLLPGDMTELDWTRLLLATSADASQDLPSWEKHLLPGERPRRYGNDSPSSQHLVVLYANLGSADFVRIYTKLVQAQVPLVVRHLGVVRYEEDSSLAIPTTLQGYGVRLDIRNVEYKVFDDRRDAHKMEGDGALNLTAHPDTTPGDFLAGIDLEALGLSDNIELKLALWQRHEQQQAQAQLVPPVWQRRQLPLQAATVIAGAENPLPTLTQVSQNLPSLASLLVNVKIPDEISRVAELMEAERTLIPGHLYINGRSFYLDRPSFNVFEILKILREETDSLRKLEESLKPYFEDTSALKLIQDAWMQGEDFDAVTKKSNQESDSMDSTAVVDKAIRIDVGRGWKNAVIYLNDVEKDAQYARWPRSVMSMIQSMQYGMPPAVRRNMFTILAVIDPVADPVADVFSLGMQLLQNSYPARMGVLWVNQDDVDECRAWMQSQGASLKEGEPCPTKPIFDRKPSNNDLTSTKATTQAVHRLLVEVTEQYEDEPQIGLAFCEYALSMIDEHLQMTGDLTMKDLIDVYSGMMQAMGISDGSTAEEMARDALLESTEKYGHALRFAAEKNLRPGMGFLNGRPVDGSDPSSIGKAFQEEQQHIFGLIMKGEITDAAPKSVYANLLSGDKVYKRVHPLLFGKEGDGPSHIWLDHGFGAESLLFPGASTEDAKAMFVAECVIGYADNGGIGELKDLLNALRSFPTTTEDSNGTAQVAIGYRILPASREDASSPLCPILASASHLGVANLLALIGRFEQSGSSMTLEQLVAEEASSVDANACAKIGYLNSDWVPRKMVILNGRLYEPDDGLVSVDDLDILLGIEFPRARSVYESFNKFTSPNKSQAVDTLGKVSSFLGVERAKSFKRTNILKRVLDVERRSGIVENPLRFKIPGSVPSENILQSSVSVVLDPVSDAAQRVSTILELLNESLGMPIDVILSPASLIDGDSKVPITSYYRFVADTKAVESADPIARFSNLPTNHLLTIRMDVPEPWDVQQTRAVQDTDNLRCDAIAGCSDTAYDSSDAGRHTGVHLTSVEYGLSHLLIFGQCYEPSGSPPNGLQLTLTRYTQSMGESGATEVEIDADGSTTIGEKTDFSKDERYSDTLVMKTVGYWQLRANPGVWYIQIAKESKGASMFDFVDSSISGGRIKVQPGTSISGKKIVMTDFTNRQDRLFVQRRPGFEKESLFYNVEAKGSQSSSDDTVHVFSLATGHLYERFLKIMMLSVTKRTSTKVKFWLFENFLSPTFKATAKAMASRIGCEVEFVTYKWPDWLRNQSEKQRIIWGYKILFLDVLFPLDVKKIIYVDADQVVRGDLKELWDMDLKGAPYGYTPFCTSRESTLGYQFWREGFWKSHLQGKPYHISALYVVDLETFRRTLVGDQLRATYQQLSADPNSLSNLDQDLPNYAQHMVPIFSLPQEWLWCESWCSDETKATAKTIDLCNNPMHKEPKVSMAKRVISGPLFEESWVELDAEVERYEKEYFETLSTLYTG